MIFRLSQKLKTKIKAGTLPALPLDENPFADWSAGLFLVGRRQHILVSNTKMKLWRASEADVRDALKKDIKERGERSRFVFVGDDEFALRSWKAD